MLSNPRRDVSEIFCRHHDRTCKPQKMSSRVILDGGCLLFIICAPFLSLAAPTLFLGCHRLRGTTTTAATFLRWSFVGDAYGVCSVKVLNNDMDRRPTEDLPLISISSIIYSYTYTPSIKYISLDSPQIRLSEIPGPAGLKSFWTLANVRIPRRGFL